MRFAAAGPGRDKERAARMVRRFSLPVIQFSVSIIGIHTFFGQPSFLKNKTALTALFLCIAALTNVAFGSAKIRVAGAGIMGGEIADETSAAFVGEGYGVPFPAAEPPSVFHDASAFVGGQTAIGETARGEAAIVERFALPARGLNWGELHRHNAVDVAGVCGSPIYAAAPGQVITVKNGWNGGYGIYGDIDHGAGVVTRYAHAERITAAQGQMVGVGDEIGIVGSTGHSTGCHVHFEVRGTASARNPFARR